MGRHSITVGTRTFPTKSKAIAFYRAILDAYEPGDVLGPEDYDAIFDLASRPPPACEDDVDELPEESVAGESPSSGSSEPDTGAEPIFVEDVVVDRHPVYRNTKCFHLVIRGKGQIPFSYLYALNGYPTDLQLFTRACRRLVASQIREFKMEQFANRPVRCAISGEVVEWEDCHVDHKPPMTFSVIVKTFIAANNIDPSDIAYSEGDYFDVFADHTLAERFLSFHRKVMVPRIVGKAENARLSSSARVSPTARDGMLRKNQGELFS